jgi:hypoxanthine phosphoribosyltransferase
MNEIKECKWSDIDILCEKIVSKIPRYQYKYVCGIPRGGLVPAVLISHMLDVPLIHSVEELLNHNMLDVLIVDDIVDSGNTIYEFAQTYDTASLYWKRDIAKVEPTYYGNIITDKVWIMFPWETKTRDNVSKVNR